MKSSDCTVTPTPKTANTSIPKISRGHSQYEHTTLGKQLRLLKTVSQRNSYLKRVVSQNEVEKEKQEQQVFQQKQFLLQNSKKKFLSLIRSKDSDHQYMKFKPLKKPLNLLRMMNELKINDKLSKSIEESGSKEQSTSKKYYKKISKRQSDLSSNEDSQQRIAKIKSRCTLQFLTSQKPGILEKAFPSSQQSLLNIPTQSHNFSHTRKNKSLEYLEKQLHEAELDSSKHQLQDFKKAIVPSYILSRNGIFTCHEKREKKSQSNIKGSSQDYSDFCLDDNNSSLQSLTEQQLDKIYNQTHSLKQDNKQYKEKKKQYEMESVKLFYRKIFCKQ